MSQPIEVLGSAPQSLVDQAKESWNQLLSRKDLGFLRQPFREEEFSEALIQALEFRKKFQTLYVIGMGGSALGGKCLCETLGADPDSVQFFWNTDPGSVEALLSDRQRLRSAGVLIVSKSGGTLEVAALLSRMVSIFEEEGLSFKDRAFVITEFKKSPLYDWAERNHAPLIEHPKDVGGRFSVFTPVGIFPLVFSGGDARAVLEGARWAFTQENLVTSLAANFLEGAQKKKSITVFWSYSDPLFHFLPWLEQLWSESLGQKQTRSQKERLWSTTPLLAYGAADQHSKLQQFMEGLEDKEFVFLRAKNTASVGEPIRQVVFPEFEYLRSLNLGQIYEAQSRETEVALQMAGHKTLSIELNRVDAFSIGALMMLFKLVVGTLGEAFDADVYVQPGVELGKKLTRKKLHRHASP